MIRSLTLLVVAVAVSLAFAAPARGEESAARIVEKVLDSDPWGLSGAEVAARATVKDESGRTKTIVFSARSRRHAPPLSKSIVRVSSPADLAGVSFLQIQKKDGDDERFLFLPDLKRSRRIAGNLRSSAFLGTDFSYADIDRRDLRDSTATMKGEEKLGGYDVFHIDVLPRGDAATYARAEMWVRKDNYVPLKIDMFAKSGVLLKTLTTLEVKRISGRWFITRSLMVNNQDRRSTELVLEKVTPSDQIPDDEFTVRNLEKI